jgi:hypothetical protein
MQFWDTLSLKDNYKEISAEGKEPQSHIISKRIGSKKSFLDTTALIRSLQRSEGENDCFRTAAILSCGRTDCPWREFCMEK